MTNLETTKLENGLTIITIPAANRVVTIDAWVAAGSANESPTTNGAAHFLEHMLFKGTEKFAPGELDRSITSVGGVWNAGTSKDYTHYYVTVAAPYFDTALDAISDMMTRALVDAGEFDKEKLVILEEWRRKQDNPWGFLYDELYDVSYEQGPYRPSVLGSFESISALSRDDLYGFYREQYSASNMAVLVAGDIAPDVARARVAEAFRDVPVTTGTKAEPHQTKFAQGAERIHHRNVQEAYVGLTFAAPAVTALRDVVGLDLAAIILADGRSSRLVQHVKEKLNLVNELQGGMPTHKNPSLFYFLFNAEPEKFRAAADAVVAGARNLAENPPTPEELAKARRNVRNSVLYSTETNTGKTGLYGYYHALANSSSMVDEYLTLLDDIQSEDIADLARRTFADEPNLVASLPNSR